MPCPSCRAENPAQANFCMACGSRLAVRHPPHHLAEKIRGARGALVGERKQVTVLFADVKGSMDLAEQVDPEAWHAILERFFALLAEGVHRFEGTVTQYTGDGIMALFGAPIAHEDHAVRACWAALALTEALAGYAAELRRERGLNFAVRIGLNSGEVVVGAIGDDLHMDYTAIGHTVGLAQRIEQLAEAGRAYVTEHTAALVRGYFRLSDLGEFVLKGVREPVRVYQIEDVGPMRTRLERSRARGLSRFVGRTQELERLEGVLAHVERGSGRIVGIVGEPGVGKSRLAWEFLQTCRARGLAVTEAHAVAHGQMVPFLPVLELLRDFFGITQQDGDREARRKVAGTVVLLAGRPSEPAPRTVELVSRLGRPREGDEGAFRETLPVLFEFLGIPDRERPSQRLDPEARQRHLLGITKRLVAARSRRRPVVLLVEDLHWLDGGSETFLANLAGAVRDARVLLVVTFRPAYRAAWMAEPSFDAIPLQPLGPEASAELLRDLLGPDPTLVGLAHTIRERTGGNPFFMEEVVQALVEEGSVAGARGAYRLVGAIRPEAIPATVQAVLAARIDRLPPREKGVLQHAAVIGKRLHGRVLARVVGLPPEEIQAALHELIAGELLFEEALYPEAIYAFKHRLTQEVAYRSQLAEQRGAVHAAVARALASLYPDRVDEHAALLAQHWEGAGELLEAARLSRRAAEWTALGDPDEALRHWRKTRLLVAALPPTVETARLGGAACVGVLNLGWRAGLSGEEAALLFAEGRRLADRGGDDRDLAMLLSAYGQMKTVAGEVPEASALQHEAVRVADGTGDSGLRLALQARLVLSYRDQGRLHDALVGADAALADVPEDPARGAEVLGYSPYITLVRVRAQVLGEMGRLDEAAHGVERAMALARDHGELEGVAWAHMDHVRLAQCTGDRSGALRHARAMIAIAEREETPYLRAQSHIALGLAYGLREEWRATTDTIGHALAIAREQRIALQFEALMLAALSEALGGLGDHAGALARAEEAVASARAHGTKRWEYAAHLAVARAALRDGGLRREDVIAAALSQAMAAIEVTGARSHEPFVLVERAALAGMVGDAAARRRALGEAERQLRAMGAVAHAERVRALPR
ncbi:MAG: adenylate/guanylate cyclase domain-containing protein [Candidatus Binatia bacterium]